jgi:tape measure domain-containing protein
MSEFIEFLSPSALSEMEKANAELVKMVANVKSVQAEMAKINTPSGGDSGVKKLTAQYQEQEQAIKKTTNALIQEEKLKQEVIATEIKQSNAIKANIAQREAQRKALLAQEQAQQKSAKAAEREALANEKLNSAYNQLNLARTKAKNHLRDLIASESASTSEIRKAQREFDILDQKVRKADKAVGDFTKGVGNYKGALSGIGNLMGAFGISTGLYLAADLVKNIFETTKQIQSLDLALRMVSGSQAEFATNQVFLSNLSEQYGIEIQGLTKNFTEFWVASKGKLEAEQIKAIFTSISKSVAVMGLSIQQQDSAFLALQQMMSKGTVQAEELKKQLGNALPGAVKAATMAYQALHPEIKVTEKLFMEQMKAGKILSAELLPELAKAYEKLYGIENVNRAETLAAAQNRLSNSWTKMIRNINESETNGLTRFFTTLLDYLQRSVKGVDYLASSLNQLSKNKRGEAQEEGIKLWSVEDVKKLNKKELDDVIEDIKYRMTTGISELNELNKTSGWLMDVFSAHSRSQDILKWTKYLGQAEGEYKAIKKIISEINKPKFVPPPVKVDIKKEKSNNTDKKERLALNFEEIESEHNLKIAVQERIKAQNSDTDEKSYAERIRMRLAFSEASINIIDSQFKKELALNEFKRDEDLKKAGEIFEKNKKNGYNDLKNTEEFSKAKTDILATFNNKNLTSAQKTSQAINANEASDLAFWKMIIYKRQDETLKLNKLIADGEITKYKRIVDNENNTLLVRETAFQKYIQLEKDLLLAQEESDLERAKSRGASKAELDAIVQAYQNAIDNINNIKSPKLLAIIEMEKQMQGFVDKFSSNAGLSTTFDLLQNGLDKYGDNWKAKTVMIMESVQEMFNFISSMSQENFAAQYNRLEEEKNIAIAFAGDSASAKEEIERQTEQKRKEIARREARAKKEQAIMNIAIDTAQAIVASIVKSPLTLGMPWAAIIAGIGALQIAMVSSQEIPQYWKGTDNAEGGLAWTQEKGREIITDSQGRIKSTGSDKGAELTMLSKGDKVFTAEKSALMFDNSLNSMLLNNGIVMPKVEISMDAEKITNEIKLLANTISNNETIQVVSDGIDIIMKLKRKNEIVERTNKRIDFKGKSV